MASETKTGPTPGGGCKSVATWTDDDGHEAEKADATNVLIVEYDERDDPIRRTYLVKSDAPAEDAPPQKAE